MTVRRSFLVSTVRQQAINVFFTGLEIARTVIRISTILEFHFNPKQTRDKPHVRFT